MNDIEQKTFDKAIHSLRDANAQLLATKQDLHDLRQKVSDAVETYFKQENYLGKFNDTLGQFIIPAPKPDPLLEAMKKAGWSDRDIYNAEPSLRAALDALGFEIREKNDDQ